MKKRILSLMLIGAMALGLSSPAFAEGAIIEQEIAPIIMQEVEPDIVGDITTGGASLNTQARQIEHVERDERVDVTMSDPNTTATDLNANSGNYIKAASTLYVSPSSDWNIGASSATRFLSVSGTGWNQYWLYVPSWITVTHTAPGKTTLTAKANTSSSQRSDWIEIETDAGDLEYFLVTQAAGSSARGTVTITYKGNGHTGGTVPSKQTVSTPGSFTFRSATMTKTNYTFVGWKSSSGTLYEVGKSYSYSTAVTGTLTVNAEWRAKTPGSTGSYDYLDDSYATSNPEDISTTISGGNSTWRNMMLEATDNWWYADTGVDVNIYEDDGAINSVEIASYPNETWLGLYQPYVTNINTSNEAFHHFEISIDNVKLAQNEALSTMVHEFGHALHLIDNPAGISANASIMNYARIRTQIQEPTSYDEGWVESYYGSSRSSISSKGTIQRGRPTNSQNSVSSSGEGELASLFADYREYSNLQDMVDDADLIIKCSATDSRFEDINVGEDLVLPYTVASVQVTEVFGGNVEVGDTIDVKQLGNHNISANSIDYLNIGEEYILFLKVYDDNPSSILNPVQSQYDVEPSGEVLANPYNTIEFSIDDMSSLSK